MRTYFALFMIAIVGFSCGDTGIAFNISKDFPVEIPMSFPSADFTIPGNPPASPPISSEYDLSAVSAFDGQDLDNIFINQLAFEMTDISGAEEIALDNLTIELLLADGSRISLVPTMSTLQNQTYTVLVPRGDPQLELLRSTLTQSKRMGFEVIFDFAEVPTTDIDFNYSLYFDVTLKIREGSF